MCVCLNVIAIQSCCTERPSKMEPSVSNSLLLAKMSVNSLVLVVFRVNGKNELINGRFWISCSMDCVADAAAAGSSNDRVCKSCCSFEMLLRTMRLKRSICGFPPCRISNTGIQR